MKNLLLLLFLCGGICSFAQDEYAYTDEVYPYDRYSIFESKKGDLIRLNKLKEFTIIDSSGKHEKKWESRLFDTSGNCIEITNYGSNGKEDIRIKLSPNKSGVMPDKIVFDRKGKEVEKCIYQYNQDSLLTSFSRYCYGKLSVKITYAYEGKRLIQTIYYKKREDRFEKKWVYAYYPDKQRKSSILYDKNGKVKYVWNYDCKEVGVLESKHKDTTAVCQKEELDKDGNKTVTQRRFDEKGKPMKIVYVYNKSNKLISQSYFNSKDILYFHYSRSNDLTHSSESFYNKKGKLRTREEYTYDNEELARILESENYTGKNIRKTKQVFTYNPAGLLIRRKAYNKKDKLVFTCKYEYVSYQ